jgi:hypothetical protein
MEQQTDSQGNSRGIALRARTCMAECGIKSVSELKRRLQQVGVVISHQQLTRHIDNQSEHLSIPVLNGLIRVFNCRVEDLFKVA